MTSKFMHMLMKVGFLPLTVDEREDKVKFKLWSKSTMFHILILSMYFGVIFLYATMFSAANLFDKIRTQLTTIETTSLWGSCLSHLSITFPIIIAKGLSSASTPASLLLNPTLKFPKHAKSTIVATGVSVLGGVLFVTAFLIKTSVPCYMFWKGILLNFFISLHVITFWTLSAFIVETLTYNLMSRKHHNLRL